jgi:quercetin dioxygenase-like cupin family protein
MRTLLIVMIVAAAGSVSAGDTADVEHLPAARVSAAFAKGEPLIETSAYKIHASRREQPGLAEVHVADTDIIYVLEGSATVVTGGTMVEGRTIGPNEIRGASIAGGETRRLVKGDVAVVRHGVPHQFQQVDAPFTYYVVKVTDGRSVNTAARSDARPRPAIAASEAANTRVAAASHDRSGSGGMR